MASRPISPEQMLAAIPSLPRPMLVRLVDHMIDRLDELDGDPDDEDNGDAEPIDEREPDDTFTALAPAKWSLSIATGATVLTVLRRAQ